MASEKKVAIKPPPPPSKWGCENWLVIERGRQQVKRLRTTGVGARRCCCFLFVCALPSTEADDLQVFSLLLAE